ncbi:glycoside hydrolase family 16 protein [Aplosporella prunicola CBS 121167]|uniref:Glycoside hydrolase family 16 protein n=1 Tax=Aplosporella prunicola CBS 121167 TaxID=1176127 RepID=A0A6A6AZY7_9PEZI|nr:glycoside hydrolase family 16 protein [Aplosporella prunicola CBS 121167]KAF2136574.1 glycoside hydrolase family 16 protein [Aplosporella prunicola CBS 121167]
MSATAATTTSTTPRPSTQEDDSIAAASTSRNRQAINPFATPHVSSPTSREGSAYDFPSNASNVPRQRFFHSRRIKKGTVDQPWKDKKDPKAKWVTIIPIVGMLLGLGIAGVLIWDGLRTVTNHEYCPVFAEDFSGGWNDKIWTKEVEVGGFGNGQFEMTTNDDENAFIKDGMLHIKPTLQDQHLIDTNTVVNLTKEGICSSDIWYNCVTSTNSTNGTIVNPVKSARLSTKRGASIKYGRVEVVAKIPAGDWLWPAIWMLPKDNVYGDWPASGEIDIMETRGNNYTYSQGGNNIISSTLHFGPNSDNDGWWTNNVKRKARLTTYADGFHTFGMEWSDKYLFTYVDSRLIQIMYNTFNEPFWQRGRFPLSDSNGTRLVDPWSHTGSDSTPFDQDFYLIINLAVGGTNGWFKDGHNGKPWVDASPTAKRDFWNAREQWLPTWGKNGEMIVKSVKMWQQKGYNNC